MTERERQRRHYVVLACVVAWFGHFAWMKKFVFFFAWKEACYTSARWHDNGCRHLRSRNDLTVGFICGNTVAWSQTMTLAGGTAGVQATWSLLPYNRMGTPNFRKAISLTSETIRRRKSGSTLSQPGWQNVCIAIVRLMKNNKGRNHDWRCCKRLYLPRYICNKIPR